MLYLTLQVLKSEKEKQEITQQGELKDITERHAKELQDLGKYYHPQLSYHYSNIVILQYIWCHPPVIEPYSGRKHKYFNIQY